MVWPLCACELQVTVASQSEAVSPEQGQLLQPERFVDDEDSPECRPRQPRAGTVLDVRPPAGQLRPEPMDHAFFRKDCPAAAKTSFKAGTRRVHTSISRSYYPAVTVMLLSLAFPGQV